MDKYSRIIDRITEKCVLGLQPKDTHNNRETIKSFLLLFSPHGLKWPGEERATYNLFSSISIPLMTLLLRRNIILFFLQLVRYYQSVVGVVCFANASPTHHLLRISYIFRGMFKISRVALTTNRGC